MIIFDKEYYNMSTIEKNIYTIQDKLTKLKPKSRTFLKYNCRLLKKIEQYKRFIETRTREESLSTDFNESEKIVISLRYSQKLFFLYHLEIY